MRSFSILGVPIAQTDYRGAVDWILGKAQDPQQAYALEAANTQVVAMARTNPEFGEAIDKFDLIVPDGMPLVWVINHQTRSDSKLKDRVYGPTLMLETFARTNGHPGYRHFLLGGTSATLTKLTDNLNAKFPEAVIAGSYSPPFGEWPDDEFSRITDQIHLSGANLIWVGLGCPKQELWIARHKHLLPAGVYFGIGAAFAFHAGEVRQAPPLFQKNGLEWVYRLAMEPRRLFKRYLTYNSLFIFHLLRDYLKVRCSSSSTL